MFAEFAHITIKLKKSICVVCFEFLKIEFLVSNAIMLLHLSFDPAV